MASRMGSSRRRWSSRPAGVVRLAVGIVATVTLGAGAMAAGSLPFSVSASAKSSSLGKALVIETEHVPKVGTVLATSSGLTLYRHTLDPAGKTTCTGDCAKVWPPLLLPKGVTRIKAPHGVKGFSALRIAGGRLQVFFHREALYIFASDTKKGQATGQGAEGTWFAVLSDDKSSAPTSTTTTTSPGADAATGKTPAPTTSIPSNTLPAPKTSNSPPMTPTTAPKLPVATPTPATTPVTMPPPVTVPPPTTTTQPSTTTTTTGYGY
jgi:predicted lipoprotein with Yx(FWY)xxD motif